MEERTPTTDSPWFYVLVFAGMALLALVVIGPKYGKRQAGIELKYQARERIAADRAVGNNSVDRARIESGNRQPERRGFASPDDTLVPLWPLAGLLFVVMILSAIMLFPGPRTARLAD
jgi:hypothetical protein